MEVDSCVASKERYVVLDESGDLGFNFDLHGTSKHLTMAFIATGDIDRVKRIVRKTKHRYRIPREAELKGYNTRDDIQADLLKRLCDLDIEIQSITAYKPNVEQRLRNDPNIFYNYVAGLILVPFIAELDIANVLIDERKVRVQTGFDIDPYIRYKVNYEMGRATRIQCRLLSSAKNLEVQAADLVAHAIFRRDEEGEGDLANILARRISVERKLFFP